MIRLLRGTVVLKEKEYVVLEIGGTPEALTSSIGLKVFVTTPTYEQSSNGSSILLHTYLQVREDALTLYGFESPDELQMFELLLGVSGVGPKVAMATMSTLSPDALRLALANEEPAVVARVPGIGKRTAQKIVLELKDKVQVPTDNLDALSSMSEADGEVIEALVALGYSVVEAQRAVQGIPKDAQGIEERLRMALSQFHS